MTSAYQGLLQYAPSSTTIAPLLATKWDVSPDGLTYTFTLRDGVKFADGTPFDSAAAKASFQRRTDMAGGPAYMLADVKDMQTPDPHTFVVTLTKPVAPFLDYLASPYGPLMTSPTAVAQHASGNDHASAWLASHTAGTGPYELTEAVPASHYTMAANKNYWGGPLRRSPPWKCRWSPPPRCSASSSATANSTWSCTGCPRAITRPWPPAPTPRYCSRRR